MAKSGGAARGRRPSPEEIRRAERAAEIAIINAGARGSSLAQMAAPPPGRAPRGQGDEYQARRQMASTISRLENSRDTNRATINRYRGQTNQRRRVTIARERVRQINNIMPGIRQVVTGPGTWRSKKELVDLLASTARASSLR